MDLKGKNAIVTGASKGIGLATVKALLDAGVKVAGWSRSAPQLSHKAFRFFKTDVSNANSVNEAYEKAVSAFGQNFDILVNNAGLGYESKFEEMTTEMWRQMFDVNVHGIFYCSRLVIPGMKKAEEGHIINLSSVAGTTGIAGMAGYCGSKHAVRGISHSMYKELRNSGIKVTCIYPGSVKTNFFDKIDSVQANDNMMMPEDIASTIMHTLKSSANYHHVDIEVRPLRPKGKQQT